MAQLAAATGQGFTADQIEAWHELLGDIPDAALEAGFARASRECKAFPSVALIREYATAARDGQLDESAIAFERLTKAVRRYGSYDPIGGKASLDPLTRQAMESCGGWGWACDLNGENRQTYAAQFRMAYQALAAREERHRRLPGGLRPAITNQSPLVSLAASETDEPQRLRLAK